MVDADPDGCLVADVFDRNCPSRSTMVGVASRWGSLALLALSEGQFRFNALRRRVDGVSEKMLAQTLQSLERDGMVVRDVRATIPPHVSYALTPLGAAVARRLQSLAELVESSMPVVLDAGTSKPPATGRLILVNDRTYLPVTGSDEERHSRLISPNTHEFDTSPFTMQSSRSVPSRTNPSFSRTRADATLRVSVSAWTRLR